MVFQYVGYRTETVSIELSTDMETINVGLEPESQLLQEVVVAADAEDPAYAVIRNAIRMRPYYQNLTTSYSCDVYVKGNQKVLDAPEKILGFEIGDLDGMLDSNRQGIVYLSESVSNLHFQSPDKYKEVVTSSKISGNDQGYSFNSAKEMEFDFYENTIMLQRQMITPISDNALNYYRYKLLGTFYDQQGHLVNKIQVIPKRESDPAFYGTIYIVEDLWNIYALELGVTSKATQLYFIDSLTFNQIFIPIEEPDNWQVFNNTITFQLSAFGFSFGGLFTANYSNYVLNPDFPPDFFDSYVHVVEKESNERDSNYWAAIRPVPLTAEESLDYHRKDSIQKVKDSPEYKDSIDRKNNRFKPEHLIGGFSHQNWRSHTYWNITGPIGALAFNTVQGFRAGIDVNFFKYFDEAETRRILFFSTFNYGFSEEKLRVRGRLVYRPTRMKPNEFSIGGGSDILQFNNDDPISTGYNTLYSLLVEKNYAKYYGRKYLEFGRSEELAPGLVFRSKLSWEERSPLTNNTDYVLFDKENRQYTSNDPLDPRNEGLSFARHQAIIFDVNASIRFNQEYVLFPDFRFSNGYSGPAINIGYRGGLDLINTDVSFHKLTLTLRDQWVAGIFGDFNYFLEGGVFFGQDGMGFMDFQHFLGNQITFVPTSQYTSRFLMLPYYSNSTDDKYFQLHLQHQFRGYILDKIPALNDLGLSLALGAKFLYAAPHPNYYELHMGLDNIGYKFFRIFRCDVVWSQLGGQSDWGFRVGVKL